LVTITGMSVTKTVRVRRLASHSIANLAGLSLEGEIRSLYAISPETALQFPSLFAQSVVESCSNIAGASTGEALVRRIGDSRLQSPEEAYKRIDTLLGSGSDTLKQAIELRFRDKIHRFYRISMSLAMRRISAS